MVVITKPLRKCTNKRFGKFKGCILESEESEELHEGSSISAASDKCATVEVGKKQDQRGQGMRRKRRESGQKRSQRQIGVSLPTMSEYVEQGNEAACHRVSLATRERDPWRGALQNLKRNCRR